MSCQLVQVCCPATEDSVSSYMEFKLDIELTPKRPATASHTIALNQE